jgi:hypothetical protein
VFAPAVTSYTLQVFGGEPHVLVRALCTDPACAAVVHTAASHVGAVHGARAPSVVASGGASQVGGASVVRAGGVALTPFGTTKVVVAVTSADAGTTTEYTLTLVSGCPATAPGTDLTLVTPGTGDFVFDLGGASGYAVRAGQLVAWGYNGHGQLGQDNTADRGDSANEVSTLNAVAFADTVDAIQVHSMEYHVCVLFRNGKVRCFGKCV